MKQILKNNNYIWSGITANHKKITGEITALSMNLAKSQLKQQGITSITLQKKQKKIFHTNKKITVLDIALFFRQLTALISAGSPLMQSCDILQKSQEKEKCQKLIMNIKNEIASGNNFANSLRKFPQHFDSLTCHLVQTGEQTGTLSIMLKRITHHKEKSIALKKQLIKALFYPITLFLIAIIVTIIMLTCIVPRFAELFQNMHGQLPPLTLAVISLSTIFKNYFWLSITLLPCSVLFTYYLKKSKKLRHQVDSFLLSFPLIGKILQKSILARLMRNLATTFSAGISITDSLNIIAYTSGNIVYTKLILSLKNQVTSGQPLHIAMHNHYLFPSIAVQMIKIGEESGTLAAMLEKMADFYESDVENIIANCSQLLEPLIMVILGVLIGGLVLAMYLPIFKLGTII